jgi:hypothetical protein
MMYDTQSGITIEDALMLESDPLLHILSPSLNLSHWFNLTVEILNEKNPHNFKSLNPKKKTI